VQLHALSDVAVRVEDAGAMRHGLVSLLEDLSFARVTDGDAPAPPTTLTLRVHDARRAVPPDAQRLGEWEGLTTYEQGGRAYVSDGSSTLHLHPAGRRGDAFVAPAFADQPRDRRQRFWAYGLLKLLRACGAYGLHAAGVTTAAGDTMLLVGPSGSGKSTLTMGLVEHGCGYLSDDSVLLRHRDHQVEALALRKAFGICFGDRKRRVDVQVDYPAQHVALAPPRLLVFPRIVAAARSRLRRLSAPDAFGRLLKHGGPELYDRPTMTSHLDTLAALVRQAPAYALDAGSDLHARPALLLNHLAHAADVNHASHRS
jgi:hypothetical protein